MLERPKISMFGSDPAKTMQTASFVRYESLGRPQDLLDVAALESGTDT